MSPIVVGQVGVWQNKFKKNDPIMLKSGMKGVAFGALQTTIRRPVRLAGIGVHTATPARVVIRPAEAGMGICFLRSDLSGEAERLVPARWTEVCATELNTALRVCGAASIATVEHILAALSGLEIDNAIIEIDGPEAPIFDGSASALVEALDQAGIEFLARPRRYLKILKPVRVARGAAFAELRPADGFEVDVAIAFDHAAIGRQRRAFTMDAGLFRREIASARTFGFLSDVERLWRNGFARGASLDNTIAVADDGIINAGGLRYRDEFVRHKILDAIGDLSLAGSPLLGRFQSFRGGHALNFSALQALFADPSAYCYVHAGQSDESPRATSFNGRRRLSSVSPRDGDVA